MISLDPLIGTLQPRFAMPADDSIWVLPSGADVHSLARIARQFLPLLPEITITPELYAACLLLTPAAVLAAEIPTGYALDNAVAILLTALRRRGFRNLVVNRLVAPCPLWAEAIYPRAPKGEQHPGGACIPSWLDRLPQRRFETILSGSLAADGRARLLIDCRGMSPFHNGSAHSMLGFLKGIRELSPRWEIEVAAHSEAAKFHHLEDYCLPVHLAWPTGPYLACVMLNQPWRLKTIAELHRTSCLMIFNILDTIAWDIISPGCDGVGAVWDFIGRYADGLLFNSGFSRDRFAFRFSPSSEVLQAVTLHSLCPEEFTGHAKTVYGKEPYVMLVGNAYDHKDVERTLRILVDAFPFTRIIAMGAEPAPSPHVIPLQSGKIEPAEFHDLLSGASVVVFPSFYEGFGLPVVHGLSCGCTVIVRKSQLWEEVAALMRTSGALVAFEDESDLTEAVGRALHGLSPRALPQGSRIPQGNDPAKWRDCAGRIFDLLEQLRAKMSYERWSRRNAAIELICS
jgi:glycosyltransferase involved in cell wall biosynthesis